MTFRLITFIIAASFVSACTGEKPENSNVFIYTNSVDINYGTDICSFTGKVIEKVRYGGKITMKNGEEHKFMSVECLAGYYLSLDDKSSIERIDLVDFAHGQKYLPPDQMVYLKSSLRPSPNGLYLTAVDRSNTRMKNYIYDAPASISNGTRFLPSLTTSGIFLKLRHKVNKQRNRDGYEKEHLHL